MNIVEQTILNQLGGNKFRVMTGARIDSLSMGNDEKSLSFKLPAQSAKNKIKAVIIRLQADDTYSMETLKKGGAPAYFFSRVDFVEGLYSNQLRDIFERLTGLYTNL